MHVEKTTTVVQRYLDALGDEPGREGLVPDLLDRSVRRLRILCGAKLHGQYKRLTFAPRNLSTDELLGGVVARLLRALREVQPRTVRQFFALAGRHLRWELDDLARQRDAQPVAGELAAEPAAPSSTVSSLSSKARRLLDEIDKLPEEEGEVFNLVRIQGLTHAEAAALLGTATKTVQRRLNRALLILTDRVGDLCAN